MNHFFSHKSNNNYTQFVYIRTNYRPFYHGGSAIISQFSTFHCYKNSTVTGKKTGRLKVVIISKQIRSFHLFTQVYKQNATRKQRPNDTSAVAQIGKQWYFPRVSLRTTVNHGFPNRNSWHAQVKKLKDKTGPNKKDKSRPKKCTKLNKSFGKTQNRCLSILKTVWNEDYFMLSLLLADRHNSREVPWRVYDG